MLQEHLGLPQSCEEQILSPCKQSSGVRAEGRRNLSENPSLEDVCWLSEDSTDPGKKNVDFQKQQLNKFSRLWYSYPWHKGNFPATVSPGGRGTKAAEKSLKCCLVQTVQWRKYLDRGP